MIGGACVAFGGAPGRELCVRHGRSVCGTLTKNVARLQKVCSPYLRAGQGAWGYDIGWVKGQCKHGLPYDPAALTSSVFDPSCTLCDMVPYPLHALACNFPGLIYRRATQQTYTLQNETYLRVHVSNSLPG
eukprot:366933-Pelagomonas_calceolata.AAC.2